RRAGVAQRDYLRKLAVGSGVVIVERSQELGDRACLALRCRPVDLIGSLAVITASIRLHDTGIHGEALALDQVGFHAGSNHGFKHMTKDVALPEAAMAIDRERRVIGNAVVEIEPAEPAIGKVKLDILT